MRLARGEAGVGLVVAAAKLRAPPTRPLTATSPPRFARGEAIGGVEEDVRGRVRPNSRLTMRSHFRLSSFSSDSYVASWERSSRHFHSFWAMNWRRSACLGRKMPAMSQLYSERERTRTSQRVSRQPVHGSAAGVSSPCWHEPLSCCLAMRYALECLGPFLAYAVSISVDCQPGSMKWRAGDARVSVFATERRRVCPRSGGKVLGTRYLAEMGMLCDGGRLYQNGVRVI